MNEVIIKNPITDVMKEFVSNSNERLFIAVPFISSFAKAVLTEKGIAPIKDLKLVTKFKDDNLLTFDLPTLKYLIEQGFEIRFSNEIHLKLYVNESNAIVSSSNLTQKGFEDNIELSVQVIDENVLECTKLFIELWNSLINSEVTKDLITSNWNKYELLKKREDLRAKVNHVELKVSPVISSSLNLDTLFNAVLNEKVDYSDKIEFALKANVRRVEVKDQLMKGYNSKIFYADKKDNNRRGNLFYDLVYGFEKNLAGTGMWENQFRAVFTHKDFEKVIEFMLPETIDAPAWNLDDPNELQIFCEGIFQFKIPQYSEALPIRLASYFYPKHFVPIFILNDLELICKNLGLSVNIISNSERLYAFNRFLLQKMQIVPYDSYVKSDLAYRFLYAILLFESLNNGEAFGAIKKSYSKAWQQHLIEHGAQLLINIGAISSKTLTT
jgi:hypothetical protein